MLSQRLNEVNRMTSYLKDLIAEIDGLRRTPAYRIWTIVATFAMALVVTVMAAGSGVQSSDRSGLTAISDTIAQYPPDESDRITVFPSEKTRRIDAPDPKGAGPTPNLTFLADGPTPVGTVQYTSRFSIAGGNESTRVDSSFNEVFAPRVNSQQRTDLNGSEAWFTDPQGHEGCVRFRSTSFDRDTVSGATMTSRNAFNLTSLK